MPAAINEVRETRLRLYAAAPRPGWEWNSFQCKRQPVISLGVTLFPCMEINPREINFLK